MTRQVYLVRRRGVQEQSLLGVTDTPNFTPFMPVRLFTDRARAEAFARELERAARQVVCPFSLGGSTWEWTSLNEETLLDRLEGIGLPLPTPERHRIGNHEFAYIDWSAWWHRVVGTLDQERFDLLWYFFDRVRFVEVVPFLLDRTSEA